MTVCPRPLTLASSLRMGPRGQKVLLRYACKKELDMDIKCARREWQPTERSPLMTHEQGLGAAVLEHGRPAR